MKDTSYPGPVRDLSRSRQLLAGVHDRTLQDYMRAALGTLRVAGWKVRDRAQSYPPAFRPRGIWRLGEDGLHVWRLMCFAHLDVVPRVEVVLPMPLAFLERFEFERLCQSATSVEVRRVMAIACFLSISDWPIGLLRCGGRRKSVVL